MAITALEGRCESYAGTTELGARWFKISQADRSYIAIKLDDPSFPARIYASLVEADVSLRLHHRAFARPALLRVCLNKLRLVVPPAAFQSGAPRKGFH